jgi:carboxyl-terminal processing protease
MRGEPNTKVVLMVFRKSESRSFPVTIVREEIRTQSVRSKVLEPGYAWLRVSQFQDRTVEDFAKKLEEIYKQEPNLKGLVLDLRNDPGGLLEGAVAVSAAFLPSDVVVVSTNGQIADSKQSFKAAASDYLRRGGSDPLKRAVIMGAQTFGKGSVQTVRQLSPDTALKITTARYYTPSGASIQAKGIVPDVMLDETAEGNLFAALRTREADLDKHITSGQGAEQKDEAREKARDEARKKLEEEAAKRAANKELKPPPEFGSAEDFQLAQALNRLKGKPVLVSKTAVERKPDTETSN